MLLPRVRHDRQHGQDRHAAHRPLLAAAAAAGVGGGVVRRGRGREQRDVSGTDAGTSGGRVDRRAQAAGARARAAREWRVSGGRCA